MPLTDIQLRQIKAGPTTQITKLSDGNGLYLLVKSQGRRWRLNYLFAVRRRTLSLGVYPAVTLAGREMKRRRYQPTARIQVRRGGIENWLRKPQLTTSSSP